MLINVSVLAAFGHVHSMVMQKHREVRLLQAVVKRRVVCCGTRQGTGKSDAVQEDYSHGRVPGMIIVRSGVLLRMLHADSFQNDLDRRRPCKPHVKTQLHLHSGRSALCNCSDQSPRGRKLLRSKADPTAEYRSHDCCSCVRCMSIDKPKILLSSQIIWRHH